MRYQFVLCFLFFYIHNAASQTAANSNETANSKPFYANEIAFPGAEGGGMFTSGGRGGRVVFVTSLADSNEQGTLRAAVNSKGKRTIVFKVSGTIHLQSPLDIKNGDLTLAGQSAPGDGICVANYPVTVSANNIIVRYLRFRMGYLGSEGSDGADAFGGRQNNNIIIDHCSISWSTDECSSFYDNENFTMQWCIISESLRLSGHSKGPHGYGAIWGGVNASFHHNLMANHDSRTPRFGPGDKFAGKDKTDARNNVFYNWDGNGCYGGEAMEINLINNYYKAGPATSKRVANRMIAISAKDGNGGFNQIRGKWGKYHIAGNFLEYDAQVSANNWLGVTIEGNTRDQIESLLPISTTAVHTVDAQKAYQQVLSYSGCSLHRDEVDWRIVDETKTGTATFIGLSPNNGKGKSKGYPKKGIIDSQLDLRPTLTDASWTPWPILASLSPPVDTDNDGMPDKWEIKRKLNPNKVDGNIKGLDRNYDNLEVYLNEIVSKITKNQSL